MKLLTGPSLGLLNVTTPAGPRSFSHYTNRGFRRLFFAQLSFYASFCVQVSGNFLKIAVFFFKGAKIGFPKILCFKLNFENYLF